MPKYQIILESNEQITDDEFQKDIADLLCDAFPPIRLLGKYKVIYAQNLEGIRKELWEKKEKLKSDIYNVDHPSYSGDEDANSTIETAFLEINNLIKLD